MGTSRKRKLSAVRQAQRKTAHGPQPIPKFTTRCFTEMSSVHG